MLSKLVVGSLLTIGLVSTVLANDLSNDIVGTYNCKGYNPTLNPTDYTGTITISKKDKQYIMTEVDANGGNVNNYYEFAIREGNTLTMGFQKTNDPQVFGIQQFKISDHGKRLAGSFAYAHLTDKLGTEVCEKVKAK